MIINIFYNYFFISDFALLFLFQRYGSVSFTLPSLVDSTTSRLYTLNDLNRVRNFISRTQNLGVATEAFQQALENINNNIRWYEKNLKPILNWLEERKLKIN